MAVFSPVTQKDLRVAAADVLQASPNTAAALENLRNQNIAQVVRVASSFLTGQTQPAPMAIKSIYADNDELAKRRKELEDNIADLVKAKLSAYEKIPSLVDAVIKAEQGAYGSAVGSEAQVATAATQAEADRLEALLRERGNLAKNVFDVVRDLGAGAREKGLQEPQVNQTYVKLRQAANASEANPSGVRAAWEAAKALSPVQQQVIAFDLKARDPALFEKVDNDTGGLLSDAAGEYYAANARQVAATEQGLKALNQLGTELDLPPDSYHTVQQTDAAGNGMVDDKGNPIMVRTLKPEVVKATRYLAISEGKGKAARKFLDGFGWSQYVEDQYKRIREEADPDLDAAREQLANLRVLTTGVDAPTTARAALRTNPDVRVRAQQVAETRLGLKQAALEEAKMPDAARQRKLERVQEQLGSLQADKDRPVSGARSKLALQKAYRQSRRGNRLSITEEGDFRKTTAPMSVAQQSAVLGSRARMGDLAQEMRTGKTLTGETSTDFATGGQPTSSAGAASKTKLQDLGKSFFEQAETLDKEAKSEATKSGKIAERSVGSTDRAQAMASRFFDSPNNLSSQFRQAFRGKASSIRRPDPMWDIDSEDVDTED